MTIISYMLGAIVIVFTVLIYTMLFGQEESSVDMQELMIVKGDYHLITAFSILIFSFSVQFMVLPAFTELEKRSNDRFAQASLIATGIYSTAFLAVGICGALLFGSSLHSDFLLNLAERTGAISVFCRCSFCFVLMFHIPYYFFLVKEYLLVIYDEIGSRAMSTRLEAKLADFYIK